MNTLTGTTRSRPFDRAYASGKKLTTAISYARFLLAMLGLCCLIQTAGCYVPLRSQAIRAYCLPDEFRTPTRSVATQLNLAHLSVPAPKDYILGPHDTLEVTVRDLYPGEEVHPMRARIIADGSIRLSHLESAIKVGGLNLAQAQRAIDEAYIRAGLINGPRAMVALAKDDGIATFDVPVMGEVMKPGVYALPKNQNDVAHALAQAGGITPFAARVVEVHRRMSADELVRRIPTTLAEGDTPKEFVLPDAWPQQNPGVAQSGSDTKVVLRIPLRGGSPAIISDNQVLAQQQLASEDVSIQPGDVILVPRQPDEVFFVVGPLSQTNVVNFRVSDLDRQLGNAFLLPHDRDVDVVTAVAMAGYIDPINSPSTVTVHRSRPGASPLLIRVDLIAARYDWSENIYVEPGDILYLNPDAAWWCRRTFDRILPELLTIPYREAMGLWINPRARR